MLLAAGCSASGGGTFTPDATSTPCSATTPAPSAATAAAATQRPDITFGFNATGVDSLGITFNGTFADPCAGVRLTGSGKLNPVPTPPQAPMGVGGCMGGLASYTSGNPNKATNVGTFLLIACDLDKQLTGVQPVTGDTITGDYVFVEVISGPYADGPYAPYLASGMVKNGNILVRQ